MRTLLLSLAVALLAGLASGFLVSCGPRDTVKGSASACPANVCERVVTVVLTTTAPAKPKPSGKPHTPPGTVQIGQTTFLVAAGYEPNMRLLCAKGDEENSAGIDTLRQITIAGRPIWEIDCTAKQTEWAKPPIVKTGHPFSYLPPTPKEPDSIEVSCNTAQGRAQRRACRRQRIADVRGGNVAPGHGT